MFYTHVDFWVFHSQHHKLKQNSKLRSTHSGFNKHLIFFRATSTVPAKCLNFELFLQNQTTAHARSNLIGLHRRAPNEINPNADLGKLNNNMLRPDENKIKIVCLCVTNTE
jgi:hypothetical protein